MKSARNTMLVLLVFVATACYGDISSLSDEEPGELGITQNEPRLDESIDVGDDFVSAEENIENEAELLDIENQDWIFYDWPVPIYAPYPPEYGCVDYAADLTVLPPGFFGSSEFGGNFDSGSATDTYGTSRPDCSEAWIVDFWGTEGRDISFSNINMLDYPAGEYICNSCYGIGGFVQLFGYRSDTQEWEFFGEPVIRTNCSCSPLVECEVSICLPFQSYGRFTLTDSPYSQIRAVLRQWNRVGSTPASLSVQEL